jgi:predicted NUDIX family NTP pyrophosphohydrolase
MERIVGSITSKTTGIIYSVRWDNQTKESWISKDNQIWSIACTEVLSANDAVTCAQRYIDGQPYLY